MGVNDDAGSLTAHSVLALSASKLAHTEFRVARRQPFVSAGFSGDLTLLQHQPHCQRRQHKPHEIPLHRQPARVVHEPGRDARRE
jgi:hypothetical protein